MSKALAALDAASRGEDLTDSDDDASEAHIEPRVFQGVDEEEESEDDAARRIQTWFRGYKSNRETSETKVREMMAEKRRTLERIARARAADQKSKPKSKPATPPRAQSVWPEDAPAPDGGASPNMTPGGFKSFVRDVAARVIQRYVREFIAAKKSSPTRSSKTPIRSGAIPEVVVTPVSGPRGSGAIPAPFRRASPRTMRMRRRRHRRRRCRRRPSGFRDPPRR